jgi:hypothetical protein
MKFSGVLAKYWKQLRSSFTTQNGRFTPFLPHRGKEGSGMDEGE